MSESQSSMFSSSPKGLQTISTTVRELIQLSDWILLANAGKIPVQPGVLDEIYRRLMEILAREGLTLLNADGPCDYERQMIVGTQLTSDSALDGHVQCTIRPGYLFHQQLFRPQEVIVYVSEQA